MDFRPTDEQTLLRRTVREFAEIEIRPHVREWDEAQHFPSELVPKLAALGLMGIQFDEQYGGAAMSAIDYCICIENSLALILALPCRLPRTTGCVRRTSICSARSNRSRPSWPR
jgi:alkylation response protein AidB-like acyl-CoA dehydrogenase